MTLVWYTVCVKLKWEWLTIGCALYTQSFRVQVLGQGIVTVNINNVDDTTPTILTQVACYTLNIALIQEDTLMCSK